MYKLKLVITLLYLSTGCSSKPDMKYEKEEHQPKEKNSLFLLDKNKQDEEKTLLNWCKKGISIACIDLLYIHSKKASRKNENYDKLKDYCLKGYGSACYYLSENEALYAEKACNLGEWRGCPKSMQQAYANAASHGCVKKSTPEMKNNQNLEKPPNTNVKGDSKKINESLESHIETVGYCYKRKLLNAGSGSELLVGRILLNMKLDPKSGNFFDSKTECSDFYDDEIARCLNETLRNSHVELSQQTREQKGYITVNKKFNFSQSK